MNPILPENCFVPDAEAHVMPDGRLYIYGSWDLGGEMYYCSKVLHCFSTDDMVSWVDHGVIFRNDEKFCGLPWSPDSMLYAPDAIHKDGKYYLYVCGSSGEESVAVADAPYGPFSAAEKVEGADGKGIDPAIFVDDDGQAYYLWGQFSLCGGKLASDMKTLVPESVQTNLLTEWENGFHEGASLRKRGSKYYIVYTDISRGRATCLSYAVSNSPLGPYKKGGVIIDNTYCDPETWNNHGSIEEFNGQWYVFYHRSSHASRYSRRVCCEKIEFDENGMIREVSQTSSGAENAIPAGCIPARAACRMMGACALALTDGKEALVSKSGGHWFVPDWAEYRYIDFGETPAGKFTASVKGKGKIRLFTEGTKEIGSIDFDREDISSVTAPVSDITGIHTLLLFLEGDFTLYGMKFA